MIRVTGDWDLAEECAQDAFTKALELWPRDGIPAAAATDWIEIAVLYERLAQLIPTPVVGLKRAVAVAMAEGRRSSHR